MKAPWLQLVVGLGCCALVTARGADDREGLAAAEIPLADVQVRGGQIRVRVRVPIIPSEGDRLLLAERSRPLGLLDPMDRSAPLGFVGDWASSGALDPEECRGWLIPDHLAASLIERWPVAAPFFIESDGWTPGASGVWLRRPEFIELRVGQLLLRRLGRQPVQRCEIVLARSDCVFGSVRALVATPRISGVDRLELWPPPGDAARGLLRSAVCFVEARGPRRLVWIAAPAMDESPVGRRIEFRRGGVPYATGLVEENDASFWRVGVPPHVDVAIEVGDEACIRSELETRERRFVARVYSDSDGDLIVDAGETDGLGPGDSAWAYRGAEFLGRVAIVRVQREYLRATPEGDFSMRAGDLVRFTASHDANETVIGRVAFVADAGGIEIDLADTASPEIGAPYALRGAEGVIGVTVLLRTTGRRALGLELDAAMRRRARVGDLVVVDPGQVP